MYRDFRDFLEKLEDARELIRIKKEVDPQFEVSAYIRKTSNVNGPAFLFEKVKGFENWRYSGGLYATRKRVAFALECKDESQIMSRYREGILHPIDPKIMSDGECKEVIIKGEKIDLGKIPIAQHSEKDAGRYIISAVEISKDPESGVRLVGIHRLQVRGRNKLAFWGPAERRIGRAFLKAEDKKKSLDVAVVIGNDPTIDFASQAGVPHTVDKVSIAGGLRKSAVELVKCETVVDLEVPRHAEIVIEGRILPDSRELEGPFGEYTGCYSGTTSSPTIEVTAITMRRDPIMHTINTGVPPSENTNMTLPSTLESLHRAASTACPEVKSVNMSGIFAALVSIKKRHEGEPYNIISTVFGLLRAKFCYVFDEDVNIYDPRDVEWAFQTRMQPHKNLHVFPVMVGAPLDPSAPIKRHTSKLGFDCTIPLSADRGAFEKVRVPGLDQVSW
ncbi:MAG: UbiD family decarboxylase [Nitrososphaerales archaeon]